LKLLEIISLRPEANWDFATNLRATLTVFTTAEADF